MGILGWVLVIYHLKLAVVDPLHADPGGPLHEQLVSRRDAGFPSFWWRSRHFLAPSVTLHTWGTSSSARGLTAGCTGAVSGSSSSERRSAWQNQVTLPISFYAPCVVHDPVLGHVIHHVGVGPVVLCQATNLNLGEVGCFDPYLDYLVIFLFHELLLSDGTRSVSGMSPLTSYRTLKVGLIEGKVWTWNIFLPTCILHSRGSRWYIESALPPVISIWISKFCFTNLLI